MRKLIILLAILLFYAILSSSFSGQIKFFLAIIELALFGEWLRKEYKLDGEYGLILLRSKKGLLLIDRIAKKYEKVLKIFADLSLVVAFGLASFFLLTWLEKKKRLFVVAAGMIIMLFLGVILAPFVLPTLLLNINAELSTKQPEIDPGAIIFFLTGFSGYISYSLLAHATIIAKGLYAYFFQGGEEKVSAGATLLLPGINLPLLEGILSLALILIVHEGSHALLTRIAKIKLLSSGIVLFGFLPIGAFVEPDEEQLAKKSVEKQQRVLAAGTGGNFLAAIVLFSLLTIYLAITSPFAEEGCLVISGTLPKGTLIKSINGDPTCNVELKGNENVTIETNHGIIIAKTNEEGKIGITYFRVGKGYIRYYENPILQFIYNFLSLAFALNFVIGVVNLLPVPFFDGYRMLELVVGEKIAKPFSLLLLLALLINFLPALL